MGFTVNVTSLVQFSNNFLTFFFFAKAAIELLSKSHQSFPSPVHTWADA